MPLHLIRSLGKISATSLVVGTIIGTGIFLKTTPMTQVLGSPALVLAAWICAGLLSMAGALVYAELGGMFPKSGGEVIFLEKAYSPAIGFLYGWERFWIGSPGSIAAFGVGTATFASGIFPLDEIQKKVLAVGLIVSFSLVNCLKVSVGGWVQSFLTFLKVFLVAALALAALFYSPAGNFANLFAYNENVSFGFSSFGVAMISALWAFDGWNNLSMAAGEVSNPKKNLPFAIVVGTTIVLVVYALANLGYFLVVPVNEILSQPEIPIATKTAQSFLGAGAVGVLSGAFVISALGAMNGSILTGSRVPFALAREGLFPSFLGKISPATHVPVPAVLTQAVCASAMALSGTFDMLTDWVVFSAWIFYGLCGFAVIRLRKTHAHEERLFRTPLFPILPIIFCLVSLALLINILVTMPKQSAIGLSFILAGLPVYWFMRRSRPKLNGEN